MFVATLGTGRNRAVTHPFPAGGSNAEAALDDRPTPVGREPVPHTITLPLARKRTMPSRSGAWRQTAAGRFPTHPFRRSGVPSSGTQSLDARCARPACALRAASSLPVSVSHGCVTTAATRSSTELETLRLGARRPTFVTETIADQEGGGDTIGNLVGRGSTIAFTTYHGKQRTPKAWLLLPRPHRGQVPAELGPPWLALPTRLSPPGRGRGWNHDFRRRRKGAHSRAQRARAAALDKRPCAPELEPRPGHRQRQASRQDTRGAAGRFSRRLRRPDRREEADASPRRQRGLPPYLLDVQGDLVAYATGGAIHLLRLSSGRDAALVIPGAAPWLDAGLEPAACS